MLTDLKVPLWVLGVSVLALFSLAYRFYGRFLARRYELSDDRTTPAHLHSDGVDFIPTRPLPLLAQHFSAISAAGPIVGPIAAGLAYGWLPGLLWIAFGCILIGAAHDFASLVASLRHGSRTVAEILREHVGRGAFLLFVLFIWLALILVIINFTSVTGNLFVRGELEGGGVAATGGAVASSSMMYLLLAILMGVLATRTKVPQALIVGGGTIGLFALIWMGRHFPLRFDPDLGATTIRHLWFLIILLYCFVASVVPMSLLLQPRGYLGGHLLYVFLGVGLLGILFGGHSTVSPAVIEGASTAPPLFPFLFVTIACGACSGFHGLVCSGTTSKQVDRETHARPVAYGAMLLEGVVALLALATVMMAKPGSLPTASGRVDLEAVFAYGIATFAHDVFGLDEGLGRQFAFLALATFIYDTLDVCTRLGRYLLQELSLGFFRRKLDRFTATGLTLLVPGIVLFSNIEWQTLWRLFGASNQLLAGLTMLGVSIWIGKTRRWPWYAIIPMVLILVVTLTALISIAVDPSIVDPANRKPDLLRWFSVALVGVATGVLALGLPHLFRSRPAVDRVESTTITTDKGAQGNP